METLLTSLKERIAHAIYKGDFLLSVNRFSDFWIYLKDLNEDSVRDLVQQILQVVLRNFLAEQPGDLVVFTSEFDPSSDKEFPTGVVLDESIRGLNSPRLHYERVYLDPSTKGVNLIGSHFAGKTGIGVFALSIHVDKLKSIVNEIRAQGGQVKALIVLCERENVGRGIFDSLQVELIPMVLFDAENWEISHVLERPGLPFAGYHRYFHRTSPG